MKNETVNFLEDESRPAIEDMTREQIELSFVEASARCGAEQAFYWLAANLKCNDWRCQAERQLPGYDLLSAIAKIDEFEPGSCLCCGKARPESWRRVALRVVP